MSAGKRTSCTQLRGVQDNNEIVRLFPLFVLRMCPNFENRNLIFTLKPPYITACMASWSSDLFLEADICSAIHWILSVLWYVKIHSIPQKYAILSHMSSVNTITLCFPKSNLFLSKNLILVSFSFQFLTHAACMFHVFRLRHTC